MPGHSKLIKNKHGLTIEDALSLGWVRFGSFEIEFYLNFKKIRQAQWVAIENLIFEAREQDIVIDSGEKITFEFKRKDFLKSGQSLKDFLRFPNSHLKTGG